MTLNISLQPEYIFSIYGFGITNTFFTSLLVTLFLTLLCVVFYFRKNTEKSLLLNILRIFMLELLKITDLITGDRELSKKALPIISTFFIFILSANLIELIPGFFGSFFIRTGSGEVSLLRSPDSDLTTTLALALFSVLAIQFFSMRSLGFFGYIKRFLNFSGPVKFILGFFELMSESIKILSFSFRLFGNIFAGEVLLLVIAFLIPFIIPVPFMMLEVFVGIIQAVIFSVLTLTFIKTSSIKQ